MQLKPAARLLFLLLIMAQSICAYSQDSWIRINQLGYLPGGIKVAVWVSKNDRPLSSFQLVDAATDAVVFSGPAGKAFGAYGPFVNSYRLRFTNFNKQGRYYLQAGGTRSPEFVIAEKAYEGMADFCLRYMRQQRCGFNPFLKDSCHQYGAYTLYASGAGLRDSSFIPVSGGWHDASDYLQYGTTTANATWHLLMAYRDFPKVFTDKKAANGLDGNNNVPDVLDEARWGIDWLLKLHPTKDLLFNQLADDRDHISMRIPKRDSQYGKGYQRPLYFVDGLPQQRGKFLNNTTGTSSTAAKYASVFTLGSNIFSRDAGYKKTLNARATSALAFANRKRGVTQTVSVKSPYIYAEDNWLDDMSLAYASRYAQHRDRRDLQAAVDYAKSEGVTRWMLDDTAKHYQWYPFVNTGVEELLRNPKLDKENKQALLDIYRAGISAVWQRAEKNAFYRGVPFIWCSNNLTTSFATQCYWYRKYSGSAEFQELEQANFDWLFGCNVWGTSMVYGLPAGGDFPEDPHSAFTHLKKYPIDGGLVDGPVYTSIYKGLIGIQLTRKDTYAEFQSDLAVYHDDYGDYSTNEPTMDGTASLIYLLAAQEAAATPNKTAAVQMESGAIIRGDSSRKRMAIVFTADEYGDGLPSIRKSLKEAKVKASFFFTGRFYRNPQFSRDISALQKDGHYMGPHSDQHLLYCDWNKRDSLLVSRGMFEKDILDNLTAMKTAGITGKPTYFMPPYEWYNKQIAEWTNDLGMQLVNFTPGTGSNADYTWPELKNYRDSDAIYRAIVKYEEGRRGGLNGFLLLLHAGTDPRRADKLYTRLPELLKYLKNKGYDVVTVSELLGGTTVISD